MCLKKKISFLFMVLWNVVCLFIQEHVAYKSRSWKGPYEKSTCLSCWPSQMVELLVEHGLSLLGQISLFLYSTWVEQIGFYGSCVAWILISWNLYLGLLIFLLCLFWKWEAVEFLPVFAIWTEVVEANIFHLGCWKEF